MKKAYLINLEDLRNYPICRKLEMLGYDIYGLEIDTEFLNKHSVLKAILKQKIISEEENIELASQSEGIEAPKRINEYFQNKKTIKASQLKLYKDDKVFAFNEFDLFESSFLDDSIISPKDALCYVSKHIYYKKLNIKYKKIYSFRDLKEKINSKMILKPSICSMGQRNVYIISSEKDKHDLISKYPNMFNGRLFIAMEYIKNVNDLWAFTLFDKDGKPYVLLYITLKGHMTKSPFEEDIYKKILEVNSKLNIKNWMACLQFLLDEQGNIHFIDLNPRLPADNDWYELAYRYLTGKSLSKIMVDLVLNNKPPEIIKTDKYIYEDEYKEEYKNLKNMKVWLYTDSYRKMPTQFFRRYQDRKI